MDSSDAKVRKQQELSNASGGPLGSDREWDACAWRWKAKRSPGKRQPPSVGGTRRSSVGSVGPQLSLLSELPTATVPALPERLGALSVFNSKSVLYGAFVWACRALNNRKRWFAVRALVLRRTAGGTSTGTGTGARGDAEERQMDGIRGAIAELQHALAADMSEQAFSRLRKKLVSRFAALQAFHQMDGDCSGEVGFAEFSIALDRLGPWPWTSDAALSNGAPYR